MSPRAAALTTRAIAVSQFESHFVAQLPETYQVLRSANLVVHPAVARIILHGSRGLAGGFRPDSDLDLTLIVHPGRLPHRPARDHFLNMLLGVTLGHWQSPVDLDLAAAFDERGCDLRCLDRTHADPRPCRWGTGESCFGLFKIQHGYHGYVRSGVLVPRVYPCIRIWRNRAYPVGDS